MPALLPTILFLLFRTTNSDNGKFCQDLGIQTNDYFAPFPNSCNKFVVCKSDGGVDEYECDEGFFFDGRKCREGECPKVFVETTTEAIPIEERERVKAEHERITAEFEEEFQLYEAYLIRHKRVEEHRQKLRELGQPDPLDATDPGLQCRGKTHGNYRTNFFGRLSLEITCHRYIFCDGMNDRPRVDRCPNPRIFDEATGLCVPIHANHSRPECRPEVFFDRSVCPQLIFPGETMNPNAPHPHDCHLFYSCIPVANYRVVIQQHSCRPPKVFDPVSLRCRYYKMVPACNDIFDDLSGKPMEPVREDEAKDLAFAMSFPF